MRTSVEEDDEGKKIVQDGQTVGRVVEVDHGTAYVDPDPGLGETLLSKLGWADRDDDTYPLQENTIEEVTDDEIRLKTRL